MTWNAIAQVQMGGVLDYVDAAAPTTRLRNAGFVRARSPWTAGSRVSAARQSMLPWTAQALG